MHSSDIRRLHANEIFHRIRIERRISQRDIVAKTGFDKSTVSSIVNRFDWMGLIEGAKTKVKTVVAVRQKALPSHLVKGCWSASRSNQKS